ncbi:MAG: hypothetical protein JO349_03795 [Candidatus Eremiobacteraeota bacterium]|nr:hypothetical protein [Candidatus Eremiobacteraeota bacterium]
MFSHVLSALGEERREALLEEARLARLVPKSRRLARVAFAIGHALIELAARMQRAADEAEAF